MSVKLSPLPFDYDALAPAISEDTLRTHHDKHHKHYVDALNELIKGTDYDQMTLQEIVMRSSARRGKDLKIYNNAGQAWNHQFYWNCLSPDAQKPSASMTKMLEKSFGSFDKFQVEFLKKDTELFGSGWMWLVANGDDQLSLIGTQNADNPMTDGHTPIMTCDLWEHAYYIDYKNEREKYAKSFWKAINWKFVESNLDRRMPTQEETIPNFPPIPPSRRSVPPENRSNR